jgi:Domain of unknown function (DUF4331)
VLNVDLNSQDLNAQAQSARGNGVAFRPSEMLRLNMGVAPAAKPNRMGVLAGDIAGFPNGRRLTDDVVDIAIQAVEGAAMTGKLVPELATIDSVDRNDHAFGTTFPYLALPNVDAVNRGADRTPRAPEFVAVEPSRLLDTRSATKPAAGQVVEVQVSGVAGSLIPTDAKAAYLNITAVNTVNDGYVTVYPCGSPQPGASSFNPIAGMTTHNLVAAAVGTNGKVCIFTSSSTDLLVDVQGYLPSTAAFVTTQPERLLDTRGSSPKGYVGSRPTAGQSIMLDVTGVGTSNVPNDASSVILNVTATNSSNEGWITVYPCGSAPPNASNVNLVQGRDRANLVAAKVGAGGNVCLFVSQGSDVIADVQGYAPAGSSFIATVPERVLDTRSGISYSGAKPIAGQTIELRVIGFGATKVPADAGTVLLNLTATDSTSGGFVTVYPCGSPRPNASNLNPMGSATPNLVAAKIGAGGRVCIYTSESTHLIADIAGYFPGTVLTTA